MYVHSVLHTKKTVLFVYSLVFLLFVNKQRWWRRSTSQEITIEKDFGLSLMGGAISQAGKHKKKTKTKQTLKKTQNQTTEGK